MGSPCSVCSLRSSARCFCTFPIACPRRRSAHLPLDGDRSGMECGNECPQWVKRRRTHYEQMFSAVHPITDIPGLDRRKLLVRLEGCYSRSSEKDSNPEQTAAQVIALALSFSELY